MDFGKLFGGGSGGSRMPQAAQDAFTAGVRERTIRARQDIAGLADDELARKLNEALKDRTCIVLQEGHGVFVEYTSADGEVYMWYPGNRGVARGTWFVREEPSPPRACFKYRGGVNPVTGERDPTECVAPEDTIGRVHDLDGRAGDPFKLASGKLPYTKTKDDVPHWPR